MASCYDSENLQNYRTIGKSRHYCEPQRHGYKQTNVWQQQSENDEEPYIQLSVQELRSKIGEKEGKYPQKTEIRLTTKKNEYQRIQVMERKDLPVCVSMSGDRTDPSEPESHIEIKSRQRFKSAPQSGGRQTNIKSIQGIQADDHHKHMSQSLYRSSITIPHFQNDVHSGGHIHDCSTPIYPSPALCTKTPDYKHHFTMSTLPCQQITLNAREDAGRHWRVRSHSSEHSQIVTQHPGNDRCSRDSRMHPRVVQAEYSSTIPVVGADVRPFAPVGYSTCGRLAIPDTQSNYGYTSYRFTSS